MVSKPGFSGRSGLPQSTGAATTSITEENDMSAASAAKSGPGSRSPLVGKALWIVVGALCSTATAAIVVLITGSFDETGARVLAMALTMAGFSLTGLAGATLNGRRPGSWLGAGTIGCSVAGMVLFG